MNSLHCDKLVSDTIDEQGFHQLQQECHAIDSGLPNIYWSILAKPRTKRCNIHYYRHQQLIAFATYFNFEPNCNEIVILVSPRYRRQSLMKQLLQDLTPHLDKDLIEFSSVMPGLWYQQKLKAQSINRTHHMHSLLAPMPIEHPRLTLRTACEDDMAELLFIDKQCFSNQTTSMTARFMSLLQDPDYVLYLAFLQGQCVGKLHLRKNPATLFDVAILPQFQNQGLGKELVAMVINQALKLNIKQLQLEVDSQNQNALKLYQACAFVCDYTRCAWRVEKTLLFEVLAVD